MLLLTGREASRPYRSHATEIDPGVGQKTPGGLVYSQKRWFAGWIESAEKEKTRQKRVVDVVRRRSF
jgi:hypothetical protein